MISYTFIKLGTNLEVGTGGGLIEATGRWNQCRSYCSMLRRGQRRGKRSAENIEKRGWADDFIDEIENDIFWSFPEWMRDQFCSRRCYKYCPKTWRECCDW